MQSLWFLLGFNALVVVVSFEVGYVMATGHAFIPHLRLRRSQPYMAQEEQTEYASMAQAYLNRRTSDPGSCESDGRP